MSFIQYMQDLQDRADAKIKKLPTPTNRSYFQYLAFVFFITGIILFIYCFGYSINPFQLNTMSSPITYLVLGFICFIAFLFTYIKI